MNKEVLITKIVSDEWEMFTNTNNIGQRSSCQDQKGNFIASRAAYWNMFDNAVLSSYLNDLSNAKSKKINLAAQKYGYMMESTDPTYFETIKHLLLKVSENKAKLVDSIMLIYMKWEESLISSSLDNKNRVLYKQYDSKYNTSVETYMRGELTSYSEDTLSLILAQFLKNVSNGKNPVKEYLLTLRKYEEKPKKCTTSNSKNSSDNLNKEDCNNCKTTGNGFNSNLAAHYSNGDCSHHNNDCCNKTSSEKVDTNNSSKSVSLKRIYSLNLELAERLSNIAIEIAKSINLDVVVTVVDASSNLILFKRMDNSLNCSIEISQAKAKTALEFKSDTLYLSHNESLKTLNNFSNGSTNYCFLGGGVPVKSLCGKIIGGLGISGGTVEQDCMVAEKTIKLFENSL